jgi:hypothetical protein
MRTPVAGRVGNRVVVRTAVLAAAVLLGAATAVPGYAAAPPDEHGLRLTLTYGGKARTVLLECEPFPHGRHPQAARACAALEVAGGDFDALPGERGICHDPYAPVVATARGRFREHPVAWRKKFANPCIAHVATGPVFAF